MEQEAFGPRFFVAVDVADPKLLGKRLEERYAAHIDLCIDHHGSNTLYAAQTLLDASAGAACEVIYEVLRELGVEMDEQIADCIYTGYPQIRAASAIPMRPRVRTGLRPI